MFRQLAGSRPMFAGAMLSCPLCNGLMKTVESSPYGQARELPGIAVAKLTCQSGHVWGVQVGNAGAGLVMYLILVFTHRDTWLSSDAWKTLHADPAKRQADHRCQKCGRSRAEGAVLDVHHVNYDHFGWEQEGDLIVLCREHHREVEANKYLAGQRQEYPHYQGPAGGQYQALQAQSEPINQPKHDDLA